MRIETDFQERDLLVLADEDSFNLSFNARFLPYTFCLIMTHCGDLRSKRRPKHIVVDVQETRASSAHPWRRYCRLGEGRARLLLPQPCHKALPFSKRLFLLFVINPKWALGEGRDDQQSLVEIAEIEIGEPSGVLSLTKDTRRIGGFEEEPQT